MKNNFVLLEAKQNYLDLENKYYQHKNKNNDSTCIRPESKLFLISLLLDRMRHEPHASVSFEMGQWDTFSGENFG